MEMTKTINALPLPDELCWLVQSYLSSTPADAIREFNEEIDKGDILDQHHYYFKCLPKNFTGGYFRCHDTIWAKKREILEAQYDWIWRYTWNKIDPKYKDGEDMFQIMDSGLNKILGVINLPTHREVEIYNFPYRNYGSYDTKTPLRNNYTHKIKFLRQLCKDNNIKVKGRSKQDVYKALMSI